MGKHAIIVIKNENREYLQKYIDSWNSYLFLNCKIEDATDLDSIRAYLKEELGIEDAIIDYIGTRVHTKFSEKDKIDKEYEHAFFHVRVNESFEIKDGFKWFSYEDLENDERIMKVNSDIVGYIKELNM